MTQTTIRPLAEEIAVENASVDEEIGFLERSFEGSYVAPDAEIRDVEETSDQAVFTVSASALLALSVTIAGGAAIFCIARGGDLQFVTKIRAGVFRVGCDQ